MNTPASEGIGPPRWPVSLLTGMLGSGKTTLLRHLLADPALRGTAILINEIGEIGLDHHLVERIDGETVLLQSGCLCCTLRADLPQTLSALRRRWLTQGSLDLQRVIVETTGLADPGPILVQLATNPLIAQDFPLAGVATTVDAQHGAAQIAARPEARYQIAVADTIVLTKTDCVDAAVGGEMETKVRQLNAAATILSGGERAVSANIFLGRDLMRGDAIRAWAGDSGLSVAAISTPLPGHLSHSHGGIGTLSLRAEKALDWQATSLCLAAIVDEFKLDLLRLKGILNVAGSDRPTVVHGVHDVIYPLDQLATWPDADHRSRLVFVIDAMGTRRARLLELATSTGIDWHPTI